MGTVDAGLAVGISIGTRNVRVEPAGGDTMDEPRTALVSLNIRNPLVAWLTYRGEMVSGGQAHDSTLSFWLMRTLMAESSRGHRSAMFRDELELEARRATHYPEAMSRLKGFYLFEDEASALAATAAWGPGFSRDTLAEVGVLPGSRVSRHDAQWITKYLGSGETQWMDRYLSGEALGTDPVWELVVEGRALVFGTELREAAYETVKRAWPASLALLELARLGVELDSDLGLIAPLAIEDSGRRRVDFVINMADAKDPGFLERLATFDGPKNVKDLRPDAELVVPDLRPHAFELSSVVTD